MDQSPTSREMRSVQSLKKGIDQLLDDFNLRAWRLPFSRSSRGAEPLWRGDISCGSAPCADVLEKPDSYEITVELPGMDPSNISVKFSTGTLTIAGEMEEEKKEKEEGEHYIVSERRWGSFQRIFQVPAAIDKDNVEAVFSNGVLTIVLPKSAEAPKVEKAIEVKRM